MKRNILLIFVATFVLSAFSQNAQEKKPNLFAYPVVPDTISTLENRSNYFISHFWENCNLSKPIKDEAALISAFGDYVVFFQYAHRNVVKASVNELMNKAQSNMKNFWLIADAAEKNLYSVGATLPSDEAYMLFVNNILRSSKVKKGEKERYQLQVNKINKNQVGSYASALEYVDIKGNKKTLEDIKAKNVIIFFNDTECEDCSIARLRLSTNVALNKLIDIGEVVLVSIYPSGYSKDWAEQAKGYSDKWIIGASENADEDYDLRVTPNIYLLDAEKKIIAKNLNVADILNALSR
ncbi:MAG: DUF5106 domain-containing protein [Muribaculaceae bacterium]|nr:DUF5106 domain-containing protein [Muribaculaceae bacterium]